MFVALIVCVGLRATKSKAFSSDDPRSVVSIIVSGISPPGKTRGNANWVDKNFRRKMQNYLTNDFIRAIEHGRDCCPGKDINLYDAELFTGVQGLSAARLFSAKIVEKRSNSATIVAGIEYDGDIDPPPKFAEYEDIIFKVKLVDGTWKVDDVVNHWTKARDSLKTIFSYPEKYGVVFIISA